MSDRSETMRHMIERAVAYGRGLQSGQTGYLHYFYSAQEGDAHLSIPLLENFMFALALLRSRNIELVNEAKTLLDGLLHFQNGAPGELSEGNFPIYVHEYPACKDRFTSLHIAAVLYWILKQYHQGLGEEMRARLHVAFTKSLSHAVKTHQEKSAQYPIAVKLASLALAGGAFIKDSSLEDFGRSLLNSLKNCDDNSAWYCPKSIGIILSGLVMVYPRISGGEWRDFWQTISQFWHRKTGVYIGPALKEYHKGFEPQVTLYDLFMGYFEGDLSARALKSNPAHLEAVMIPPSEDVMPEITYPLVLSGEALGRHWKVYHDKGIAYSLFEGVNPASATSDQRGVYALKLVWGDRQRAHTLVAQAGNNQLAAFSGDHTRVSLQFNLGEALDLEDKERCRDLIFYLDAHDGMEFLVSGDRSSTFRLGDTITMEDRYCKLAFAFKLIDGEGRFFGHRMLGNRPAQLNSKGLHRYDVYDWQLFIRTVGRSQKSAIAVTIDITQKGE